MYREYAPCPRNASYSFKPILLKLYRSFEDGLKIRIVFFPFRILKFFVFFLVIFFRIFNLDYFRVIILLKYIEGMHLVLEEKRDIVFGFPCPRCVVRNGWFRISSRYLLFIYSLLFLLFNLEK